MGDSEQYQVGASLMQTEHTRQFDETTGLWYLIHWDEVLKCYVSQLAPGQDTMAAVVE
jgi:hypothetical protein